MTRDDIIRMAHESHIDVYGLGKDYTKFADALERFAALAEPQTTHWEGCEAVHPECKEKNT